jgi:hypothetical protein
MTAWTVKRAYPQTPKHALTMLMIHLYPGIMNSKTIPEKSMAPKLKKQKKKRVLLSGYLSIKKPIGI